MDDTLSLDEVKAVLCDEAMSLVMARPEAYGYVNRAPHEAVALVVDVLARRPELAGQLAAGVGEQQAALAEERAAEEAKAAAEQHEAAKAKGAAKRRGRGPAATA